MKPIVFLPGRRSRSSGTVPFGFPLQSRKMRKCEIKAFELFDPSVLLVHSGGACIKAHKHTVAHTLYSSSHKTFQVRSDSS